MHSWVVRSEDRNPHDWIHQVAAQHGCESPDNAAVLDCLRDVGQWELFYTSCPVGTPSSALCQLVTKGKALSISKYKYTFQ